jgi:hypothetical protein
MMAVVAKMRLLKPERRKIDNLAVLLTASIMTTAEYIS